MTLKTPLAEATASTAPSRPFESIPVLDIAALFSAAAETGDLDSRIGDAGRRYGAFVATGLPAAARVDSDLAAKLMAFFALPEAARLEVATKRDQPTSPRSYRGFFRVQKTDWAHTEMYDIGPEPPVAASSLAGLAIPGIETLIESNAWPEREPATGWRGAMLALHAALQDVGEAVLRAYVRSLGVDDAIAAARFHNGNSTLRLLHYPPRPSDFAVYGDVDAVIDSDGRRVPLITMEHVDTCCLSLLWQVPEGGLQTKTPDGDWCDVPPRPGTLSIHFGNTMETMSDGVFHATPHRVLGRGAERHSLGFFLEPALDASVGSLRQADDDAPSYGKFLLDIQAARAERRAAKPEQ